MQPFTDKSFQLLRELTENNTKDWYQAHKSEIEAELLTPFAGVLDAVSVQLSAEGMAFSGGKHTMFRMHRDTRFSKDKSPYKTNVSGVLTPAGDKREADGFVYLQLGPDGGFAAFGRYGLDAKALGPIRDRILAEADAFRTILDELQKNGLDLVREDALKSMPRGYADHAGHYFAEELKLTNMIIRQDLAKSAWLTGGVATRVAYAALACKDFIEFVSV